MNNRLVPGEERRRDLESVTRRRQEPPAGSCLICGLTALFKVWSGTVGVCGPCNDVAWSAALERRNTKDTIEEGPTAPLGKKVGPGVPCHWCKATLYRNEQSRQWVDDDGYVICPDKKHDHEPNLDDFDRGSSRP